MIHFKQVASKLLGPKLSQDRSENLEGQGLGMRDGTVWGPLILGRLVRILELRNLMRMHQVSAVPSPPNSLPQLGERVDRVAGRVRGPCPGLRRRLASDLIIFPPFRTAPEKRRAAFTKAAIVVRSRVGSTLALAAIAAFTMLLTACSGNQAAGDAMKQNSPPAVPVEVAAVTQKTVPVQLQVIGTVEAYATVSVESMVAGQVQTVHFDDGQYVGRGDLLFSIDPRPFQAMLDQAQANLARDQAQLQNAQLEDRRYTELYQQGIVSQDQYDQYHSTAAQLAAGVRADQAAVENAKIQLSYCSIRSPMEGRAGAVLVDQGNLVKTNDVPMVVINQVQPIYVAFAVPQQYLSEVKALMSGRLRVETVVPHEPDRPEWGVVTFVNNTVDTTTGTILLKGTFPNPTRRLWPGEYVNVVLTLSNDSNAVVAPSPAVQTGKDGDYVYVLEPNRTVQYRLVTTGPSYEGSTVIQKGLRPGETVVTDGQILLHPGAKVEVKSSLEEPGA